MHKYHELISSQLILFFPERINLRVYPFEMHTNAGQEKIAPVNAYKYYEFYIQIEIFFEKSHKNNY